MAKKRTASASHLSSTTGGKMDPHCSICESSFTGDAADTECIDCDSCGDWIHIACTDLTVTDVKTITRLESKGVRFFCPICVKKPGKIQPIVEQKFHDIDEKLDQINNTLAELKSGSPVVMPGGESKSYATMLTDSIAIMKEHKEAIQKTSENTNRILSNQSEFIEQEKRKTSAVVHRLSESGTVPFAEKLTQLCESISFKPSLIIQSFRLGRIMEGKSRPIKLVFQDELTKWDFIKRINSSKPNNVFATMDLTKEEREKDFHLRSKARSLKEQNPDDTFRVKNSKIYKLVSGSLKLVE